MEFKKDLAEVVVETLKPIQKKFYKLINEKSYLQQILDQGRERAQEISNKKVEKIKNLLGLGR